MAKRRKTPVENPISADLIAAAVSPVSEVVPPPARTPDSAEHAAPKAKSVAKPANSELRRAPRSQKTLRVRFPDTEFAENESLTKALRRLRGGSKVTESDITRALWSLARRAEEAMTELKAKAPKTPRPANGDWISKAEYDDAVARFLHLAIKKMGVGD